MTIQLYCLVVHILKAMVSFHVNDVWCLDLGAMTCQPKIAKGAAPEGRYGHTAT